MSLSRAAAFLVSALLVAACSAELDTADPSEDGGSSEVLKGCATDADCGAGLLCAKQRCVPPEATDGDETDVDCGGAAAPACDDGKQCAIASDCTSKICTGGVCQAPSPDDGVQNGDETDVDCGGGAPAPPCADEKKCSEGPRDCTSKVCTGGVCQSPTGDDGVQNGDETDIDCGGSTTGAARCASGLKCAVHEDCASNGCGFDDRCAAGRSCTARLGGVTCGAGEVGTPLADHESCCATATLAGTTVKMDKYHVTAGRMRAFVERTSGNVRAFAKTTAGWNSAWDALVPANVADADMMLGSYWAGAPNDSNGNQSKRSCASGYFGGHTYFTPRNGDDYSDFTKDQLDVKALNCVGWHLARAFCSWEGGRLPTQEEIANAFKNGKATEYPWGGGPYNPEQQDSRLNHVFNYGFPNSDFAYPGGRRILAGGGAADIAWHVSPPGRFPLGRNQVGIEIAGNLLHWIGDGEYRFLYTLSWENHGINLTSNLNWRTSWPGEPNGYYAIGFRCVYD